MTTTETQAKPFYKHETFTATYYPLYIALEQWLSTNIFRQDLTRIFLASDEYAFRRRFELTDTSEAYDNISASSLQFPFANYSPSNSGWMPDEREATNSAALMLTGVSFQTRLLRAMAVQTSIGVSFYFDREADARLAYEALLWLSYRERFLYTSVGYRGEMLDLPLNIKIQDLSFNPDFKESSWLTQNRIFVIKAALDLRSFSLQPLAQPMYTLDAIPEDSERFYLTEETVLQLRSANKLIGELTVDTLYNQNPDITVNQFAVISSTATTVRVSWEVASTSIEDSISKIYLSISPRDPVLLSTSAQDYTFRALTENSTYYITLKIITEQGKSKTIVIQATTPLSEESALQLAAVPNSLVGITW